MSTQTGSISFESTQGLQSYAKQNYATLSQIKGQFATCGTGASTAAKVATIVPTDSDWSLYTGATVTVKFTSANTASTPTLNVNGSGAKQIRDYAGNALTEAAYKWLAGSAIALTYDGTYWRIQDSNLMERVHSAETAIEQNSNAISLKANSSDVYTKTQTDGLISTEVTNRNAAITTSANSITSTVANTYTTKTEFNNLKIGGRNLVRYSDQFRAGSVASPSTMTQTVENGLYKMVISGSNSNYNSSWFAIQPDNWALAENVLSEGDSFTISFTMKSPDSVFKPTIYLKNGLGYYSMNGTMSEDWSTIWYSGIWKDANTIGPHLGWSGTTSGTFYIKNWKLEKGNKPTDWTPAPEDLEAYTDTQVSAAESRITQTTDNITSEVSKISSAKYVNSSTASWTLANIKTYAADDNTARNWNVTSTTGLRVGDTVYIKGTDSTRNCPVYIKTTVTAINSTTQFAGKSHGYEDVLPVDTIKSTINQSADSIKIAANHIEIDGTTTFKNNNTTTTLSNYLNANYDAAGSAQTVANNAALKTDAVSRTQRIYYRQTAAGAKPGINETWLATSGTGYGNWSLTVPQLTSGSTKYPKLYTAVQTQTVAQQAAGSACSCSPVQLDDTTTVIDGGNIITGSVSANSVDANSGTFNTANIPNLNASKITAGDIAADRIKTNVISAINSLTAGQIDAARIKASDLTIGESQVTNLTSDLAGAAQTATNYITTVSNDGIWITPSDAKPSNGQPVSATRGWHIADALEYFRGTVRYIKAWLNGNVPTVRLGQDASGHADVTSSGLEVFTDDSTSVADFGEIVRIGQPSRIATDIMRNGLRLYSESGNNGKPFFSVTMPETTASGEQVPFSVLFEQSSTFPAEITLTYTDDNDDAHYIDSVYDLFKIEVSGHDQRPLLPQDTVLSIWGDGGLSGNGGVLPSFVTGYDSSTHKITVDRVGDLADALDAHPYALVMGILGKGATYEQPQMLFDVDGGGSLYADYHSLQLIDKEGNTYFHVSDLRDANGDAEVTEYFRGDSETVTFTVSFIVLSVISVKVNGVERSDYVRSSDVAFTFSTAPYSNALIAITYVSNSGTLKAYTFGQRASNSTLGAYSFAEGRYIIASGTESHAEGYGSQAVGDLSHAECMGKANGTASHAEGYSSANGKVSHSEGEETYSNGYSAHSEGGGVRADGDFSHAEGFGCLAGGNYSHAQNYFSYALGAYQTALGKYNVEDANDTYAVIIGNGTSFNACSNALTVEWNGNVEMGPRLTLDADSNNTGALRFQSENRLGEFVKLYGGADANGDAIVMGDGGLVVIGGGESGGGLYNELINSSVTPGDERLCLASDTSIYLYPNCQTIANRKELIVTNKGCIQNNAARSFGSHSWLSILNGETAIYVPKNRTSSTTANYAVGALSIETPGGGGWSISNYNSENLLFTYIDGTSRSANQNNAYSVNLPAVSASKTICFTDHVHDAGDITSGTLGVARGGTGKATHTSNAILTGNGTSAVNNVATANGAFYATAANGAPSFGTLPIAQGGTGKTTAADAWTNLGGGSIGKKSSLAASDISSGTFAIARIPTGTTSTTVSLGNHTHTVTNKSYTGSNTAQIAANGTASITVSGTSGGTSLVGFTYLYTNHNTVIGIAGNNETTVYVHNLTSTARAANYCTVTELRKYMF